eukprot:gene11303-23655_t
MSDQEDSDNMYADFSDSGSEHDDNDHHEENQRPRSHHEVVKQEQKEVAADDQRSQKLQGKIEYLQTRIEDLTMELETEKNLHENTRKRLELKSSSSDEVRSANLSANAAMQRASDAEKNASRLQEELHQVESDGMEALEILQKDLAATKKALELEKSKNSGSRTGDGDTKSSSDYNNDQQRILELESSLEEYKQLSENLKNRLDASNSSGFSDEFKEEFTKFCVNNNIDYDVSDGEMNETIFISILQKTSSKMKILQKKQSVTTSTPPVQPRLPQGSESELQTRVINLEEELRLALAAAEDIRALKAKIIQLVGHVRHEKENRLKSDSEAKLYLKKMNILSSHIEKLMAHLKHEATAKIKYMDQLKLSESDVQRLKQNVILISRKSAAKDKLIIELREGSKVLEDQLRLMDEKYLELRTKLDWSRDQSMKRLKKAETIASDLRMKFMYAGNSMLLDSVQLPDIERSGSAGGNSQVTWPSPSPASMQYTNSIATATTSTSSKLPKTKRAKGFEYHETLEDLNADPEASMNNIMEKIRRHKHESAGWTDDKLNDLVKPR